MIAVREQKITLGEMHASGVRDVLIYCSEYRCSHWTQISADRWGDDVRPVSACGKKGADVRLDFKSEQRQPARRNPTQRNPAQ